MYTPFGICFFLFGNNLDLIEMYSHSKWTISYYIWNPQLLVETEAVQVDILKDATSPDVHGQTVLTYMILTQITKFSNVKDAKMCGMTEHM